MFIDGSLDFSKYFKILFSCYLEGNLAFCKRSSSCLRPLNHLYLLKLKIFFYQRHISSCRQYPELYLTSPQDKSAVKLRKVKTKGRRVRVEWSPQPCAQRFILSARKIASNGLGNRKISLFLSLCVAGRATDGGGGRGRSQIIRRRESLDICKSFNTPRSTFSSNY